SQTSLLIASPPLRRYDTPLRIVSIRCVQDDSHTSSHGDTMRTHLCRAGGATSLLACMAFLLAPASTQADDKLPESLRLVPADAVLYSASLRNAEQWKAITSSKAWEKLTTLESVAPFYSMARDWMKAKENREILD